MTVGKKAKQITDKLLDDLKQRRRFHKVFEDIPDSDILEMKMDWYYILVEELLFDTEKQAKTFMDYFAESVAAGLKKIQDGG